MLIISQHSVKFSGNRVYGIRDIKLLNCHLISSDYVVRGSWEIVGGHP